MAWSLLEQKVAADGGRLYLVADAQNNKYLLEPLNLTLAAQERLFVELLREIKALIKQPLSTHGRLRLICYEGVEKYQDEYCLRIGYAEELWANWSRKGEQCYPPPEVAAAALGLVELTKTVSAMDCSFEGFFPGDLLPLGGESWGLLDPRVQKLLAAYRDGGEIRNDHRLPMQNLLMKSHSVHGGTYLDRLATGVPFL